MKYLLVFAVVFIGIWMWRHNRIAATQDKKKQSDHEKTRTQTQQIMVSCAYCGLHLPQTEALSDETNATGLKGLTGPWFCSSEHRKLGVKAG